MDPLSPAEGQRRLAQIQGHLQIYIYIYERADQFLIFNKGWFNI